jgi:hypothetical protein
MILMGLLCLVTPFVISTATIRVALSKFEQSVHDHLSQFFTTENGGVATYCTAALACAVVMMFASISIIFM